MHPVIHFETQLFDVSLEKENPINPIHGTSLLDWIKKQLHSSSAMTEPQPEDWGRYSYLEWQGRNYMIGAAAHQSPDGNHEWVLSIEKSRSLKEKIFGQAKLDTSDSCFAYIKDLISAESNFKNISVELGR